MSAETATNGAKLGPVWRQRLGGGAKQGGNIVSGFRKFPSERFQKFPSERFQKISSHLVLVK
eukprot:COSAG02_NODE_1152_length_14201_cov_9.055595_3_plen_62_part_00